MNTQWYSNKKIKNIWENSTNMWIKQIKRIIMQQWAYQLINKIRKNKNKSKKNNIFMGTMIEVKMEN